MLLRTRHPTLWVPADQSPALPLGEDRLTDSLGCAVTRADTLCHGAETWEEPMFRVPQDQINRRILHAMASGLRL